MSKEEYKSREFCRDIKCQVQIKLDEIENEKTLYDTKTACREHCGAYEFHQWLKDNKYSIVREG